MTLHSHHIVFAHHHDVLVRPADEHVRVQVREVVLLHHHVGHVHILDGVGQAQVLPVHQHVQELHVACEEVCHVDLPVEGEAERHRVETHAPATSPALLHDVDVHVGHHQVGLHWGHDHVHLQRHTSATTQRQQEPVRESDARLEPPAFYVYGLADRADDVLHVVEETASPRPLLDDTVHLQRVAHDGVLASFEFVQEGVDFNHVEAFVVDAHEATGAVVFRTNEDADHSVDGLF